MKNSTLIDEEVDIDLDSDLNKSYSIILYNDEYNSIDYVVLCLIEVLGYGTVQAEQLVTIVHNTGKAKVKTGELNELKSLKQGLVDRGLSANIVEN